MARPGYRPWGDPRQGWGQHTGKPGFGGGGSRRPAARFGQPAGPRPLARDRLTPGSSPQRPGGAASPNPPRPQAPTFDPLYYNQVDQSRREEAYTQADLAGEGATDRYRTGLDDPTNPFSQAEMLKRNWLAKHKAASAALASRGQLYSGAHERALAKVRFGEARAWAELRDAFEARERDRAIRSRDARVLSEEEVLAAMEDQLQRAPEATDPGDDTDEVSAGIRAQPRLVIDTTGPRAEPMGNINRGPIARKRQLNFRQRQRPPGRRRR